MAHNTFKFPDENIQKRRRRRDGTTDRTSSLHLKVAMWGKLLTNFLSLHADSASCKNSTVMEMDIKMAGPLRHLIDSLPRLGELPHQPNIETAETSLIEEVQNRKPRSPTLSPDFTNEKIDVIAKPIIGSYRELQKPITDRFGGTLKSHISISMIITSFIVAMMCRMLFHWAKPYLPCMRRTKVGMLTQNEFDRMSTNKMKYYRVIFCGTRERKLHVVSNTPDGFQELSLVERAAHRNAGESGEKWDEEKKIENSPYPNQTLEDESLKDWREGETLPRNEYDDTNQCKYYLAKN